MHEDYQKGKWKTMVFKAKVFFKTVCKDTKEMDKKINVLININTNYP